MNLILICLGILLVAPIIAFILCALQLFIAGIPISDIWREGEGRYSPRGIPFFERIFRNFRHRWLSVDKTTKALSVSALLSGVLCVISLVGFVSYFFGYRLVGLSFLAWGAIFFATLGLFCSNLIQLDFKKKR